MAAPSRWSGALVALLAATVVLASFTAWTPLLEDARARLLGPLVLLALVIVVSGIVLRALRAPVSIVPLAQLLLAAWLLSAQQAPGSAGFAGLPGTGTLDRMTVLLERAIEQAQLAAPVTVDAVEFPLLPLLLGVVALLLADLVSVALSRPALVALPALVVITVPVVVLTDTLPQRAPVLTAIAYAALLAAQHAGELAAWSAARPRGRGWAAAAATSAVALIVAVVLTPVLPTRGEGVVVASGSGAGDRVNLENPIADLKRDLQPSNTDTVMSVTVSGERPPTYIRTTVLDVYSGERWEPGERTLVAGNAVDGRLPLPNGQADTGLTDAWQFSAQGLDSPWLPMPFPARSAVAPGFYYDDSTLDAYNFEGGSVAGTRWSAEALNPGWKAAALRDAGDPTGPTLERWTALPDDEALGPVADLARDLTRGAGTPYDQAVALQQWFQRDGGFTYSLEVPAGNDEDSLVAFLEPTGRVGYCEQFSASMAVMARSLGIPARVAVGFLSGTFVPTIDGVGNRWDFSGRDLHAWPELYFPGSGWVRFEPTPAARTGQPPAWTEGVRQGGARQDPSPTPTPQATAEPRTPDAVDPTRAPAAAEEEQPADEVGTAPAQELLTWVRDHVRGLLALALLALVMGALGIPAWIRSRRRAARRSAAAHGDVEAAWKELLDHARDLGIATDPDATVRRNAQLLNLRMGVPHADRVLVGGPQPAASPATVSGAVHHLAHRLEQQRYAPAGASDRDADEGGTGLPTVREDSALTALDVVCRELTERATPAQARRARWWPPSVMS